MRSGSPHRFIMIDIYFGLPRSGKSCHGVRLAKRALKKGIPVFSNYPIKGCTLIQTTDIGKYDFSNSLIIVDEAGIDWNNRKYKAFPADTIEFLKLHGHYHCNIVVLSQAYDDMDITVRRLAERLFVIKRGILPSFSHIHRIGRILGDIDPTTHQITDGYKRIRFSLRILYNRPTFKYFDSWSAPTLLPFESKS